MKKNIIKSAIIAGTGMAILAGLAFAPHKSGHQPAPTVETVTKAAKDLSDFEAVRDSLYDYAMTICTAIQDSHAYQTYVDADTKAVFETYRVPNLHILLCILDEIDDAADLADIYDDENGTLWAYDRMRGCYEAFFNPELAANPEPPTYANHHDKH